MKALAAVLLLCIATTGTASPADVESVESIAIPVSDMARATEFYTHVLAFKIVDDHEVFGSSYEHFFGVFGTRLHVMRLRLGDEAVELLQFLAPRGRPLPIDLRANDRAFQHIAIIVSDMDRAYAWLRRNGVEHASTGPQVLPASNPNAGGIAAFYFRDPEGNFLEILHFPPGKGAPRWQSKSDLFLGIDHTAIVVADTEESLHYYRDLLGLSVAGVSANYGTEQEHLNNVFGAHLRITSLRAAHGPGVELLEYLTPRTGRPIPPDSQASDRWYWQINFQAAQPESIYARAADRHAQFVSNGVVPLETPALGFTRGFVARDPDGHAAAITAAAAP